MRICESKETCSEGFSTRCSFTSTTPAITIACAFVRDSASPRSTKSLSMRSRFTPKHYFGRRRLVIAESRSAGSPGHGARCVAQVQLAGAIVTEPDENVRRVGPEERTDLPRDLHRVVSAQSLQRTNVEDAVVELAVSAVVTMDTLPLTKHLFGHYRSPAFLVKCRGLFITCEKIDRGGRYYITVGRDGLRKFRRCLIDRDRDVASSDVRLVVHASPPID